MKNSNDLLPRDKHDFERVNALEVLDKKELEKIIPDLLEWLQDMNWPIAEAISKLLLTVPHQTIPYVFGVLRGHDDIWKEWCLRFFVLELPLDLIKNFEEETRRIAFEPTKGEVLEEVHLTALEVLQRLQSV
ncbi:MULTISPECIES: DUF5071 domain-containing protein [unclassified Paenibacillus]|uniref:DUF5071 domain-containing protein n=1 Tax=unclassified Paenibacillus TaxID=185978 RepID=UPI0036394B03